VAKECMTGVGTNFSEKVELIFKPLRKAGEKWFTLRDSTTV